MTKRYQQARKDYEFLREHHDADAYDIGGGFNLEEHCFRLLSSPTKTCAAQIYEDLIDYSFDAGFEESKGWGNYNRLEPDLENEQVREIYERRGLL